ncbi:MAG TPA: hypothetical protein VFI63_00920 [Solirubrobacterales bacterium]|nr:hypothetical protein [Solirubrobacterales bacterium]
MKRLGPELKMPELKPPTFLVDLWWDLWDRRLLPLVALIVVATVAVPFLMGNAKEVPQSSLAAIAAAGAAPTAASGGSSHLAVVEARPGLRDYRKRLNRNRPTDPFMQRFTAPVVKTQVKSSTTSSTSSTSSTSGGGGGSTTTTSSGPVSSSPSSGGEPTSGAPSRVKRHLIFFTFAIDAEVTRTTKEAEEAGKKPETWVRNRVMPLKPVPGKDRPVVTYMGVSKGKVLLLVSTNVKSESGEGKCVSGEEACQLLEVEPGFPETFVYGPGEVSYTIKVLKVKLVIVRRT